MAPSTAFIQEEKLEAPSSLFGALKIDSTRVPALAAAQDRFIQSNPTSLKLHKEAINSLPGGNTRSLLYTAPFPICLKSGKGYQVIDEDDHTYTDFVGEMTAGLLGHSNPLIRKAIVDTIDNVGLNLGGNTSKEGDYGALLCSRFKLDRIRFCNSGTEANLHAFAAARRFTGKRKIVVFAGGYHGAVFSFGGGKSAENNVDKDDWIIAKYNDVNSAKAAIRAEGVAAVILEGMQGGGGCICATSEFLHAIQNTAKESGVLFLLDEVMTSRFSPNGIAGVFDLKPDLKSYGKYLGGGLAFGAFGGRLDVMSVFDPRDPNALAHSGTFNNNTLAMNAGYVAMSQVYTPEVCTEFSALGDWLLDTLKEVTKGTKLFFSGKATIIGIHVADSGVQIITNGDDLEERWDLKDLFWMEMMEEGFWITRRGMIALILGTPKAELERFVECTKRFLVKYSDLMKVPA